MPASAFASTRVPGRGWVSPLRPRPPPPALPRAHLRVPGPLSPPPSLLPPIGNLQSDVAFHLTLDPGRLSPRAVFKETSTRHLTRGRLLGLGQHCEEVKLLLPVRVSGAGDGARLRLAVAGQGKSQCALVLVLAQPSSRLACRRSLAFLSQISEWIRG